MARFYFHISDSSEFMDRAGVELPGLEEVRTQAVVTADEALKDLDGKFRQSAACEQRC
jgi:hypothetical protein